MRPDGTHAPEPTAIIGSVHAAHFRLYPDVIVLVTSAQAGAVRQEIRLDPNTLSGLQWSKSEEGRGYLRFHQAGSDMDRNDPDDPDVVRCSPEELQLSLKKVEDLYPSVVIRQSPHFGQIKSVLRVQAGTRRRRSSPLSTSSRGSRKPNTLSEPTAMSSPWTPYGNDSVS